MKKYDQIHESIVKDIFDMYNGIKDMADGELSDMIRKHKNTRAISSIARKSNDLICVFPVLASRNISMDVQAMAAKAIEKNCVAMLQMLFSAMQLSDADNAFDFIQTFHTNINKSAKAISLDDVVQIADAIGIADSAIQVGGKVDYSIIEQVRRDMKNLNYYFESDIPKPLAEGFVCNLDPSGKYIVHVETRQLLKEDHSDDLDGDIQDAAGRIQELEKRNKDLEDAVTRIGGVNNDLRLMNNALEKERDYHSRLTEKRIGDLEDRLAKTTDERNKLHAKNFSIEGERETNKYRAEMRKNLAQAKKDNTDFFSKQVLNTEYKKANELMPTLMVVNFKAKTDTGYETIDSVVIGVKAKLYPMASEDMITHLVSKAKDANWMQKFIKASTREISFFKDFLFAIDKAKVDALSMSRKGSANKMWKVLERRANKSRFNKLMARSNDATAITTVLLSQNEVDFIKKEFQIDITDVYNTRILMEKYNLLGISVVDESLEIAKFMWDTGEDLWETVSFNNLERESNDNTYKKVVNLMTKVM